MSRDRHTLYSPYADLVTASKIVPLVFNFSFNMIAVPVMKNLLLQTTSVAALGGTRSGDHPGAQD